MLKHLIIYILQNCMQYIQIRESYEYQTLCLKFRPVDELVTSPSKMYGHYTRHDELFLQHFTSTVSRSVIFEEWGTLAIKSSQLTDVWEIW